MVINIEKNTGNFAYKLSAEPSDKVVEILAAEGLVRLIQGGLLGGWEKKLAYPGDAKRPKDFKRSDIAFGPEGSELLSKLLKGLEVEVGQNEKEEPIMEDAGITSVEITEYTGAAKAEPKYKAAKDLLNTYLFEADGTTPRLLKSGGERTAESFATSRGIEVPTDPWSEDTAFLKAVTEWQRAQASKED